MARSDSYERRRGYAHGVQSAGAATAIGTGSALAVERVRDRYASDKPKTLKRVAGRLGPLENTVRRGRVPPSVMAVGALGATTAFGAEKAQNRMAAQEIKRSRRAANRRSDIAARAPQEVIEMETGILAKAMPYRAERHRKQAETGAATGGVIAAEAARRSYAAQGKAREAASTARSARTASALTTGFSGAAGVKGASGVPGAYKSGRAAFKPTAFDESAHPFTEPPRPDLPRNRGESPQMHGKRIARAHRENVAAAQATHGERLKVLQSAHEERMRHKARMSGLRAAGKHLGLGGAGAAGTAVGTKNLVSSHLDVRRANKAALHHTRQLRGRGAAAAGLLATAAALHESKGRKPPPRISYTGYGPPGAHL